MFQLGYNLVLNNNNSNKWKGERGGWWVLVDNGIGGKFQWQYKGLELMVRFNGSGKSLDCLVVLLVVWNCFNGSCRQLESLVGSTSKWHGINENKPKRLEVDFNGTNKRGLNFGQIGNNATQRSGRKWRSWKKGKSAFRWTHALLCVLELWID